MQETAVSPTPEDSSATPTQAPVENTNGTAQTNGSEAAGAAPSEETFISGDPNSLPPELKQAYNNMLKDYKQKTQSIAESKKKAENWDKINKDERVVNYLKGLNQSQRTDYREQKAAVEKKLGEAITDDEFQKALTTKEGYLNLHEKIARHVLEGSQKKIETLEQKLAVKDAQDIVDSFATELGQDGKPVREDFYKLDEDKLITGYLQLTVDSSKGLAPEEYTAKLNEAYQWAKGISQKYYNLGKSEAMQVVQKKAGNSTIPPTQHAKGSYDGPDPKTLSAKDAIRLARQRITVPRDD